MPSTVDEIPTRAFVIGYPVKHSRSPTIHGYWLKKYALFGSYEKIEIAPGRLGDFIAALKSGGTDYAGGNVTLPHKESVFAMADRVDETARLIGAINTVWMDEGRLAATNTDAYGFAANLDDLRPGWDKGKIAVVLGAGGASRAVVHSLLERGFSDVRICNRTLERARELADRFGSHVTAHESAAASELLAGADLFVNTTSLGLAPGDIPAIDFTVMAPGGLVTDIVYVPLKTPFLAMAEDQGIASADGLGMLLHQAVPGFEIWFGRRPEVTDELRRLVIADMETGR